MMPLTNFYADGYLQPLVTAEREARAVAQVADLGTLPAVWVTRLQVLQAYIITCLEAMKSPDDLFSAKLKAYQAQFKATLEQARYAQMQADQVAAVQAGADVAPLSPFTIMLERS